MKPQRYFGRWRLTLASALAIGTAEFAIMLALRLAPKMSPVLVGGIDALCLLIPVIVVIRMWILPPLRVEEDGMAQGLIAGMSEGMVVQDSTGRIIRHNPAALQILGLSSVELLGRSSLDSHWRVIREDGSTVSGYEHPSMIALRTGTSQRDATLGIHRNDGSWVWVAVNSEPVLTAGRVSMAVTTFTDITEKRVERKSILELSERLSTAVQALKLGVWDWDLKAGTLVWDEFMYELFQIRKEDFSGDYDAFDRSLLPEDAARVKAELEETFRKKAPDFRFQFRVRTREGNVLHIAAAARCAYDPQGQAARLVGNNWDVSAEVHDRAVIAEQHAKLIESSKMASLGVLSAGVAHEINNPLQVIQASVDLLPKSIQDPKKLEERMRAIDRAIHRITAIVSGLRKYSRTSITSRRVSMVFADAVREASCLTQPKATRHGVQVSLNIRSESRMLGDELEVGQVLINLVNNAIDAVSDITEKWVRLDLFDDSADVCLRVTDSGHGIAAELRDKIFDPFFTTKAVGAGTGIGLSISKGIVETHRGSLRYVPGLPNTCFELRFPKESVL